MASGDLELWALNRNDGKMLWKGPIAGGNHIERKQNMSSPSPGDRRADGLGDDRRRRAEGVRLQGQGALGARHPEGLRHVRAELGLRLVAAAPRRRSLRAGAARHEDRRSVVRPAHRRQDGQDRLAAVERPTNADQRIARLLHDAGAAPVTARATEIVITGGDVVTGHDPASGKELWRMDGLNPTEQPVHTGSSPRRSSSATS